MYAIAFDLQQVVLKALYHNSSSNNAYAEVEDVLEDKGFERQQESVYFPQEGEDISAVDAIMAVQEVAREFTWFAPAVSDIRLLRIEDKDDLRPVSKDAHDREHPVRKVRLEQQVEEANAQTTSDEELRRETQNLREALEEGMVDPE